MKPTYTLCMLLLLGSCITSCNDKKSESNQTGDLIEVELSDFEVKPIFQSMVKLETTDSCLIQNIKNVEFDADQFFILSRASQGNKEDVYVFDKTGKFIRSIGLQGQGPEEYISINSFILDKANRLITIVDTQKKALITYDYEGNWKNNRDISSFLKLGLVKSCKLFNNKMYGYNYIFNDYPAGMHSIDLNTDQCEILFSHAPFRTKGYSDAIDISMSKSNDRLIFTKILNDTIFSINTNGEAAPYYRIDHKKQVVDPSTIKEPFTLKNVFRFYVYDLSDKEYFKGYDAIHENSDYIFIRAGGYRTPHRYLIDKRKKRALFEISSYQSDTKEFPLREPDFVINDQFIRIEQPHNLISDKDQYSNYDSAQKIIAQLNEDDNPCLVFYTLD